MMCSNPKQTLVLWAYAQEPSLPSLSVVLDTPSTCSHLAP